MLTEDMLVELLGLFGATGLISWAVCDICEKYKKRYYRQDHEEETPK